MGDDEIVDLVHHRTGDPVVGAVGRRERDGIRWKPLRAMEEGGALVADDCIAPGREHGGPEIGAARPNRARDDVDARVHELPGSGGQPAIDGGARKSDAHGLGACDRTTLAAHEQGQTGVSSSALHRTMLA